MEKSLTKRREGYHSLRVRSV